MTGATPPIPRAPANVLALKALWRDNDVLARWTPLAVKVAAERFAKAGASPREAMGRAVYEFELTSAPSYHDGKPRRQWADLCEATRETWRQCPLPRSCPERIRL